MSLDLRDNLKISIAAPEVTKNHDIASRESIHVIKMQGTISIYGTAFDTDLVKTTALNIECGF